MTDRERLIQYLVEMHEKYGVNLLLYFTDEEAAIIADKLLAQGVIVPPVKVGDKVWRRGGDMDDMEDKQRGGLSNEKNRRMVDG